MLTVLFSILYYIADCGGFSLFIVYVRYFVSRITVGGVLLIQKEKSSKKKLLKKLSPFYIIAALCIVSALGVSLWSAKFRVKTDNGESTRKTEQSVTAVYTVPAADIVTDVPDTRRETAPDTSKTEEETSLSRAAQFVKPIDTDVIKAFSGDTLVMSKTMGDWRTHNGTDYAGNIGDPVRAVNNGRVTRVYDDVLWGTTVEIDHLDGLIVRYCGLGKGSTVSEGDEVKINDKIGNLSEIPAESADGTHFHIEAEKDEKYIDFESLLTA